MSTIIVFPSFEASYLTKISHAAELRGWDCKKSSADYNFDISWLAAEKLLVYGNRQVGDCVMFSSFWRYYSPSADWLARIPLKYVGRKISWETLGEASSRRGEFFMKSDSRDSLVPGVKWMKARVYDSGDPIFYLEDPGCQVLVSEVVYFEYEVRCFVSRGVVLSACIYMVGGSPAEFCGEWLRLEGIVDAGVSFLDSILGKLDIPPSIVIDVGRVGGDWVIVEANESWASDYYSCDVGKVLDCLEDSFYRV